ncbi:MAG: ABC transporter permease subunit [Proteobacteria bacterium]|nr:ABC transporter permease subunit [Pseudomonadota bacterium]
MRSAPTRLALGEHLVVLALVVLAIGGWWWMSLQFSPLVMPSPWAVLRRTTSLFVDPALLRHTLLTTARVWASVAASLVIGFALAVLARANADLDGIITDRLLVVLNAFPSIGWAILAVIWFRVSNTSVLFVQVMILLPFCVINFAEGLRNLDAELIEMAHSFTRRRRRVLFKVALPMVLPYGVAALRVSYGICWKIALVAELFGAQSGYGYLILQAQAVADATSVVAICLAIVVLFAAGDRLVIDPIARRYAADRR